MQEFFATYEVLCFVSESSRVNKQGPRRDVPAKFYSGKKNRDTLKGKQAMGTTSIDKSQGE
jgi:hypothetical protein